MAPTTTKAWTVQGKSGFDALKFDEQTKVPEMGDKDVLIKSMSKCIDPHHIHANMSQSTPLLSTTATSSSPWANTPSP
jgi:hypothetical protein